MKVAGLPGKSWRSDRLGKREFRKSRDEVHEMGGDCEV